MAPKRTRSRETSGQSSGKSSGPTSGTRSRDSSGNHSSAGSGATTPRGAHAERRPSQTDAAIDYAASEKVGSRWYLWGTSIGRATQGLLLEESDLLTKYNARMSNPSSPDELRVIYLSGPDARADASVLISYRVKYENLLAVDLNEVPEHLHTLDKIIPFEQGQIQQIISTKYFRDIIYVDWTSSIFSPSLMHTVETFVRNPSPNESASSNSPLTARRSILVTNFNIHSDDNPWSKLFPNMSFGALTQEILITFFRGWLPWLLSFPHQRFDMEGSKHVEMLEENCLESLLWKLNDGSTNFIFDALKAAGAKYSPKHGYQDVKTVDQNKWIAAGLVAFRLFKSGKVELPQESSEEEQEKIHFPLLLAPWHNSSFTYYGGGGIGAPMQIQILHFLRFSQPIRVDWQKDSDSVPPHPPAAKINRLFLHYPRVPEAIQILEVVSEQFESLKQQNEGMREILQSILKSSKDSKAESQ